MIISQIGAAVQAAHTAKIVHRDLKPENVMYDPETQQVKLLDFGIATDVQAPADERLTRAGFFVGSLMYIAPEALSGEIVTPAADQYSLATIAILSAHASLAIHGESAARNVYATSDASPCAAQCGARAAQVQCGHRAGRNESAFKRTRESLSGRPRIRYSLPAGRHGWRQEGRNTSAASR